MRRGIARFHEPGLSRSEPDVSRSTAILLRRLRPARPAVIRDGTIRTAMAAVMVVNTIVASSTFNPALTGLAPDNTIQQYLTLAAWLAIVGLSFVVRTPSRIHPWLDVVLQTAFYLLAIVSVVWSDLAVESALKAAALALTVFGAYRLAVSLPVERIAESVFRGLLVIAIASIAVVALRPDVGINHEWMHAGLWQGAFESKQSLGVAGAFLMYLAFCRLLGQPGWVLSLLGFAIGIVCVVGSGSRGGGAVALISILLVVLSGRSVSVSRLLAFLPILIMAAAGLVLFHLGQTGQSYLVIFGEKTDLTERLLIWQYALSHLGDHFLLGYGLNGFWSDPDLYYRYKRLHGWVLDNFHSGYLTVLMETGLVGFALLSLAVLLFGVRMSWLAGRSAVVPAQFNLIVGYMCLFFIYNLTETFLDRSTNIITAIAVVFVFASARETGMRRAVTPGRRNAVGAA